jgi:hypothetical protein
MNELKFVKIIINYEIDEMKDYLDLLRIAFEKHLKERKKIFIKDSKIKDNERTISLELEIEKFISGSDNITQLFLSSFVVSWVSFIEQSFIRFCEENELKIEIGILDNEKLDSGIRRARKFLKIAKGYEIDKSHWDKLMVITKIRNHIVHEGRRFNVSTIKPEYPYAKYNFRDIEYYCDMEQELFDYLSEYNIIYYDGVFVRLKLTFIYCYSLVAFAREIFTKIYSDIEH